VTQEEVIGSAVEVLVQLGLLYMVVGSFELGPPGRFATRPSKAAPYRRFGFTSPRFRLTASRASAAAHARIAYFPREAHPGWVRGAHADPVCG